MPMPLKGTENIENMDEQYWASRYQQGATGWDIGYVSTPLKEYIDQLTNKELKILIPGAGNSYEAEYLWQHGFHHLDVLDIAREPLDNLKTRVPELPDSQLLYQDFFELDKSYDLILEQTFFCALNPTLRPRYVEKMYELLKPGGKLVGLLFNIPLYDDHPPFGGHRDDYLPLFSERFEVLHMETAHNSIPMRAGNELFIMLTPLGKAA